MPSMLAFIMLLGWPVIAAWLFFSQRFEKAIIWSVVFPFLFMPSSFAIDLPGLPALDRISVPNVTLLAFVMLLPNHSLKLIPRSNLAKICILLVLLGPFFTVYYNGDSYFAGPRPIRGTEPFDAISWATESFFLLIPFLVARSFLTQVDQQREILMAMLWAGLVYSLLILIEVRLSPQLHIKIYGFFPHSFLQQIRDGGFRPVVFLRHGLWVAFFTMSVAISAAIIWRATDVKRRQLYGVAAAYMTVVLVLCKSLASLIYCLFLLPVVMLLSPKNQVRVAALLVAMSLAYPMLRGADLFPVGPILSVARAIDVDRADSLQDRFDNEDILLDRAKLRPVFGWGGWGRSRVYNIRGKDVSVTDGRWIVLFGTYGWVGFIGFFGLLAIPVFALLRLTSDPAIAANLSPITSGLSLLVAINMVEFLPNSTLPMMTMLIGGALLGHCEKLRAEGPAKAPEPAGKTATDRPRKPRTVL
ncbi:MAG: hypothetical protein AAGI13_01035 [Pseudomonadota bacterium]